MSPPDSPPADDLASLLPELRGAGLLAEGPAEIRPLSGGVSSDIARISQGERSFVIKRALAKLKVKDAWFADVGRNRHEQDYLRYAARIAPGSVPRILHGDRAGGWFAMEDLADGWVPWKSRLLAGDTDPAPAAEAGRLLGCLHAASWGEPQARATFDTSPFFQDLRVSPYLETTADRCPDVANLVRAEALRLTSTRLALVHGDFSPKNMLVQSERLVLLDAEVAWFGDPTFDVAFLVTHLLLKAVHLPTSSPGMRTLATTFWNSYATQLGPGRASRVEAHLPRLTLCLLLARVHGKSPVEYLSDASRALVSRSARALLIQPPSNLAGLVSAWPPPSSIP
jgi:aminoglycoside phosphotransferase (APT) family kinase protein